MYTHGGGRWEGGILVPQPGEAWASHSESVSPNPWNFREFPQNLLLISHKTMTGYRGIPHGTLLPLFVSFFCCLGCFQNLSQHSYFIIWYQVFSSLHPSLLWVLFLVSIIREGLGNLVLCQNKMLPPSCFCCWGQGEGLSWWHCDLILSLRCFESFSGTARDWSLKHCQVPEETILSDYLSSVTGMYIPYKTYI